MPDVHFLFPVGDVSQSRGFALGGHQGIDFSIPVGTPVHASGDGIITYQANETDGYGNILEIDHASGYQTRYAHLSMFKVGVGAGVKAGDVIALSGGAAGAEGAGNSDGPHLHFEIRLNGVAIDPQPLLSGSSNVKGDAGPGTNTVTGSLAGDSGLSAVGHFFGILTTGATWIRVGEVVGGLLLLIVTYKIVNEDLSFSDLMGSN